MSSLTKLEKRYDEVLEELFEKKKIEKINQKIKRHETIERINIKEETKLVKRIKADIIDETKALEDIGTILRNVKTAIFKKIFGMKLMSKKH